MKCIISFVTEIVETSSNAELGWYMKIIKPNKRTMTHTLLSSKGVVRKWSSVQGLCPTLIPHPVKVISNRRIAPTTQVSFKITGSCNVWGQVNIIYSLNSNFGFKQKINYLGVGFFMGFFFVAAFCYRLITRLHFSQTWTTCSSTEWHVINCYVSSKVSPPDSFKDHLNNQKHCTV